MKTEKDSTKQAMNENKGKIADFLTQPQMTDLAKMRALLSPKYRLDRSFKIQDIMPVAQSIRVVRKFNDIDERKLSNMTFGELIIEFTQVIKENIPEVNLTLFLNNINTLTSKIKEFSFSNFIFNEKTAGQYIPKSNTIELSKKSYAFTIDHELFHAATTFVDEETNTIFCGFQQITNKTQKIGEGLNEGYTQYLTEKYFRNKRPVLSAYHYEKALAEVLEKIISQEAMQHFYFNADLKGLIEYLKQYMPEEEIYRFIYILDFLNEHMDKKNLTPSSNETIFNSLKYCNSFLIQLAIKKIMVDNAGKELTTEDISENLASVIALIPGQIKSNNKTYTIPNASIIMDIILKYDEDEKNKLKR